MGRWIREKRGKKVGWGEGLSCHRALLLCCLFINISAWVAPDKTRKGRGREREREKPIPTMGEWRKKGGRRRRRRRRRRGEEEEEEEG